jgi:hypothetical protein
MQEQGRSRYVKYVFPFVDCAIEYYVRMRRPARMSDIIRCMREGYKDKFSIKSVGKFIVLRILLRSMVILGKWRWVGGGVGQYLGMYRR